jgi:hypothetical protein
MLDFSKHGAKHHGFNLSANPDLLYLRALTEDIDLLSPDRGTAPSGSGPVLSFPVPWQMVQLCHLAGVSVLPTAYQMCMSLNLVSPELLQGHHPTAE